MATIEDVFKQLEAGNRQRILAFGSSNTERYLPGMHWFDCVELAIRQRFGRVHSCLNAGIGGDTTRDLLRRFEQDAAIFQPHAVFITIGGNDANPARDLSEQEFRDNLLELHQRFSAMNCAVIFQTYYAFNGYGKGAVPFLDRFYVNMQIVREVAAQTQSRLIDHLARWEPFRQKHPEYYIQLMRDPKHVTPAGNMVLGLDIAHALGLPLGEENPDLWSFAKQCLVLMDAAEQAQA